MPASKDTTRDRSLSGDFEESDEESHVEGEGSHPPGKPGRKKNPNSQAARRDQNRIAQREFRLRKQQRIRDLEARVELLSGGKDEAMGEMSNILKDLMQENQTLRGLLQGVSAFIGQGAGGLLPKLGWEMADFTNFVNRSETDTAWESYQMRKKAAASGSGSGLKRSAEDDANGHAKKARGLSGQDKDGEYSMLLPLNRGGAPVPVDSLYPTSGRSPQEANGIFSDLMRGSAGSPMFIQSPSATTSSVPYPNASSAGVNSFPSNYAGMPPMNMSAETSMPPPAFRASTNGSKTASQRTANTPPDQAEDDGDPKKAEAMKLIHYHLDNYTRNTAYCLPSSLRPTSVQRSIHHEGVIDRILHPELRDRMILMRGGFDLTDCLVDYHNHVTIHGDDVLAHSNWEISETWLRKYGFLVEQPTLNVSNRWRRERGEAELRLVDIVPMDTTTST